MNDKTEHTRFHIERGYAYDKEGNVTQWTRETIAGQRTLAGARRELKQMKKESAHFKDWRIVKRTVIEEVVE
jgi:hypothetical protein